MIERSKYRKKFIMLILAAAVNISITSYAQEAEEVNADNAADMEESVKADIYQVIMPTETEGIFDFILDPQGLINATNGAAYEGKKFEEDSTVFFKRTDGKTEEDYSNKSDCVTIINKSSVPVNVSVEVSIDEASIDGIIMSEDKEFKNDTERSLYLAITDGKNVFPIGKDGASFQTMVEAAQKEAYEIVQENGEYRYKIKDNLEGVTFPEYSFQLTGAANKKGNWTELEDIEPKISITWRVNSENK